ncbi:IS66 family insertion sequence element accessory protein TnpB [Vibrio toranzoniae]|jgi:transposase|uniref:IS66 family insertion sequence element accessory protein TnpB n=1 Tax=Vibrio toranzoniae TaxID=1194427 RepID=UPI0013774038|nr:IS66 family insertion sequence element accessory protein TnpB [Vibrio toranzoniae]
MLIQNPEFKIWLYTEPVDMRKQFDGLAALVQSKFGVRASNGELFVFINRKRTMMKILYYRKGGYCLWSKRLERGLYQQLGSPTQKHPLTWTQLQCLIDGIDWQKAPQKKRF